MNDKVYKCLKCGDTERSNFISYNSKTCKKCISLRQKKYKINPIIQQCTYCNTTNPEEFESKAKKICIECYKTHDERIKNRSRQRYHIDENYKKNTIKNAKRFQKEKVYRYRFLAARKRAQNKNLEFNITPEYIEELHKKQNYRCRYSKLNISRQFSIDRIDSTKGYIIGNIALTANAVNTVKSNLTLDQFIYVVKKIYENTVELIDQEKINKLEAKFNNELIWSTT